MLLPSIDPLQVHMYVQYHAMWYFNYLPELFVGKGRQFISAWATYNVITLRPESQLETKNSALAMMKL